MFDSYFATGVAKTGCRGCANRRPWPCPLLWLTSVFEIVALWAGVVLPDNLVCHEGGGDRLPDRRPWPCPTIWLRCFHGGDPCFCFASFRQHGTNFALASSSTRTRRTSAVHPEGRPLHPSGSHARSATSILFLFTRHFSAAGVDSNPPRTRPRNTKGNHTNGW